MSDLMDRVKAATAAKRIEISVPEWGDENGPLTIYAGAYTLGDDKAVRKYLKDDDNLGFAEVVVRKAESKEGEKLFDRVDSHSLVKHGEAHVIKRIALAIMSGVSMEGAEGN